MIELYDVNDINLMNDNSFTTITKSFFIMSVVIFIIFIILSLIIWRIGIKINSEKTVKFGIKVFFISSIMQICIMLFPILMNIAKKY